MSQQKRKQAGKKRCVIILLRKQTHEPSTAWKPRIFSAEGGGDLDWIIQVNRCDLSYLSCSTCDDGPNSESLHLHCSSN